MCVVKLMIGYLLFPPAEEIRLDRRGARSPAHFLPIRCSAREVGRERRRRRRIEAEAVIGHVRSLVAPGGSAVIVDVITPGPRAILWHRWWGVADAMRTLRRRRSVADAWTVLRLRQHPTWMRHARVNQPLTRPDFHRLYSGHFPGATFVDDLDPFICALSWRDRT